MATILFLTQVLPYPLDAGPKVRAYYMLRHLAGQHQVTLVSFVRPDDRPEYVEHLRGIARAVHTVPIRRSAGRNVRAAIKGLLTGLPVVIARDEMAEMAALLSRLAAETPIDVVHADQLSMAWWGRLAAGAIAQATRPPNAPTPGHPWPSPQSSQSPQPSQPSRFASLRASVPFALPSPSPPSRLRGPTLRSPAPATLLDEHNAIYLLTERMAAEASGLRRLGNLRMSPPSGINNMPRCHVYGTISSRSTLALGHVSLATFHSIVRFYLHDGGTDVYWTALVESMGTK